MTDEERCRLCPERKSETGTWICCDVCETWYHVRCLKLTPEEFDIIDQYHCADCIPKAGPSTLLRKSSRRTGKINYADLVNGVVSHNSKWRVLLDSHQFLPDKFERVQGRDLTLDRLRVTGFRSPIIVKQSMDSNDKINEDLDMKMPPSTLTIDDICNAVGVDTPVEVIDVATQSEQADWTMGSWAEYFGAERHERVYNVISLEISGTPLGEQIKRPAVVRELDWIDNFWPEALKSTEFPKVQLYCLMSVKDSFTDFHIDFAGSSVFYHILSGSKIFYFVEPTPTHLKKYAKWSSSSEQSTTFFGDEVAGKCYKVELQQGDTMLIPAGWIHAVYTPMSSIVIGGNFVHSLHIPMQYRVCDIEMETSVSPKFRFPFFEKLNWFVALGCMTRGQDYLSTLSPLELQGLLALTVYLYNRHRMLKNEPHKIMKDERHMIRASVPTEAFSYANGGLMGLLRDLNQLICSILEGPNADKTTVISIDNALRLLTEEEEQQRNKEEEEQKAAIENNKPRIKLRIKLNSTTSSTNSGDEDSIEQQVPNSATCTITTSSSNTPPIASPTMLATSTTVITPPKIKLKIPLLSSAKKSRNQNGKSGRAVRSRKKPDSDIYESGNELDDLSGSDSDPDQQPTSDEEWNASENHTGEGLDEAKDNDEDDELEDEGCREDLRSSDSEYDEGGKRPRKSRRTSGSLSRPLKGTGHIKSASLVTASDNITNSTIHYRIKVNSSETVYFGDDKDTADDCQRSPNHIDHRPSKRDSDEEDEVVLGLGKKRKLTPKQFSALLTPTSSGGSSSVTSTSAAKKKAALGVTAKDRIRNILMKRR
ncbi:JmjC domain-containing histone demethylation protein 1 [Lobosporangium transversale]|uniref:JmjC domain-containing histone demethylation protein 1 n=1 Tax=Lobosporangium transversale TaxID=64571 RepID=A0A1Y2GA81_9FUNG|nr:hypothetical protein BCR41DRAFT_361914 [Lobosporangium transversale]KAF9905670.1 JmjC domain-containing histone demethylation protein 1 [Lobosporangium transversale]ORZ05336.1 hypothetical protein BCR41DRAFT_361914 [Lobosporangium transversale]|eukprot:XP_021877028.1 hypothetical protein BCR41DRAFT_361914 [Lobosporangium transversale]